MLEYDNDNLERFFQKATKEPEVKYNEADWRKLEEKLDAETAKLAALRAIRLKRTILSGFVILIFSGLTYLLYDPNKLNDLVGSTTNKAVPNSKITATSDSISMETKSSVAPEANGSQPVEKELIRLENKNEPLLTNVKSDELVKQYSETIKEENVLAANYEMGSSNHITYEGKHSNSTNLKNRSNEIENSKKDGAKDMWPSEKDKAHLEGMNNKLVVSSLGDRTGVPSLSIDCANVMLPEEKSQRADSLKISAADSIPKYKKAKLPSHWSFVFSFAPDFSSVGLHNYTAPGETFGLQAHYHFNPRLSIAVGTMLSNKKYFGYGSEYKPPVGYWKRNTNGIIPQEVQGSCQVLEVPLSHSIQGP
jgi:hypothetical protein